MPTLNKTATIERMPAMEQRLGLVLEGLYAAYDPNGFLTVNFDVVVAAGELDEDVEVIVSAHNAGGQIIGTATEFVDADDFFALDTLSAFLECPEPPARIRVYPKRR